MASSLTQLSACVTRILSLTGFPKELKTRDIQLAFSEWEGVGGGFKIKWIDDTSLLIVFQDATVGQFSIFLVQLGLELNSLPLPLSWHTQLNALISTRLHSLQQFSPNRLQKPRPSSDLMTVRMHKM
jgi:hypothetical protein